ncbi:unnamed protein product [Paramecium sonneborni]|uniref:CSC1/OSCA1-like cytosolic domain-containing protein n=1 Tax=Paramecium sonneborni TaxID=65129 RepID=A0A8S1MZ78_9CILI|nr:unnamed protein product [Paramecium sonneborni]
MLENSKEYDPFQIPADINISIKHKKATQCGTPIEKSELCPCCGREVEQEQKEIGISPIDLNYLGQGIPLFFLFLKQMVVIVLIILIVMGIYSMITNSITDNCLDEKSELLSLYQNGFCDANCPLPLNFDFLKIKAILKTDDCSIICNQYSNVCTTISSTKIALSNKQLDINYKEVQAILVLCSIILFKILSVLFRRHSKLTQDECDRGLLSASDFTAMLTKLPKNQYTEQELRESLTNYCKQISQIIPEQQQFEIVKITIAFDIFDYINIIRTKTEMEKKYQINESYKKINNEYPQNVTVDTQKQLKQDIDKNEEELTKIDNDIQKKQFTQTTQVAFVTFQTKKQLETIIEYTKLTQWELVWTAILKIFGKTLDKGFYFKYNLIQITRAPEPDDVFWENCGYNLKYKIKQRIISWIITSVLLISSFFILFGLDYVQNNYLKEQNINYVLLTIISLIISFIISIINAMIYYSITILAQKEKHYTKTHYDVSVATKLIYVQFINSGLLIMATNILVQGLANSNEIDKDIELQSLAFSRPGGVAQDAFIITLINALITPLISYFDIFYLRKLIQQKQLKQNATNNITQTEANTIFEGPQVLLYDNYAYVCKTVWITLFFAPLVPVSLLFCVVGLFFYYWIQKYLLLRRKCRPPLQSSYLNSEMCNIINFSPILLAAGQLWVDFVFESNSTTKIINFISIGISGLEFFLPFEKIAKRFLSWPDDLNELNKYSEKWLELPIDYDRINPITRQQATQNYVKFKQSVDNKGNNQNIQQNDQTLQALRQYAQEGGEYKFKSHFVHKLKAIANLQSNKQTNNVNTNQIEMIPQSNQQQQKEDQTKLLLGQQQYISQIERIQQQIQQTNNVNLNQNNYNGYPSTSQNYQYDYNNQQQAPHHQNMQQQYYQPYQPQQQYNQFPNSQQPYYNQVQQNYNVNSGQQPYQQYPNSQYHY